MLNYLNIIPEAELSTVSGNEQNRIHHINFDPQSPFAFEPPEYDSLPKDPPNYIELFGTNLAQEDDAAGGEPPETVPGSHNTAFQADDDAPPCYTLTDATYVPSTEANPTINTTDADSTATDGEVIPTTDLLPPEETVLDGATDITQQNTVKLNSASAQAILSIQRHSRSSESEQRSAEEHCNANDNAETDELAQTLEDRKSNNDTQCSTSC